MIHRDLKPENIFIINNKITIGDFDIAKFSDNRIKLVETKKGERLANYYFLAPEQSEKGFKEITEQADWYALGQIIHWMILGRTLRGQSQINFKDTDKRYSKYEYISVYCRIKIPKVAE
ncbi:MAG: protein kinase [Spirochaetes bacterium]|nr:protein kinase [Spirochaetota bacterium]